MKPTKVFIHWSESGAFADGSTLEFAEFERRAERAAMGHKTGGYLKTKIKVFFDNGDSYECRIDLAADDEKGFADGIRKRIAHHESRDGTAARQTWAAQYQAEEEKLYKVWKSMDFRPDTPKPTVPKAGKRNPLYDAAAAAWRQAPGKAASFNTTDTAKLIRAALKVKFPKVKFSVRSDIYAGGSSIRVRWTDGPTAALVDAVIQPFAGSGFDGMTDSKYQRGAWLMPDGTAAIRKIDQHWGTTEGNFDPSVDGAIPADFGVDFVFGERSYSADALIRCLQAYAAKWDDPLANAIKIGMVTVESDDWGARIEGTNGIESHAPGGPDAHTVLHRMRCRRMLAC